MENRVDALRQRTKQRTALYKRAFSTRDGKKLLMDLLKFTEVYRSPHCPGDPYETAFYAGKQAIGLEIIRQLNITDEEIQNIRLEVKGDE